MAVKKKSALKKTPPKKAAKKRAVKKGSVKKGGAKKAARKNTGKPSRRNPDKAAAERYEYFHGRAADVVTDVETPIKYHGTLSGIGKLEKLTILSPRNVLVTLAGFGGALLAQNEKGTQLFVTGGDQSVTLADFGIEEPHENEFLGTAVEIWYATVKDHLGDDGGDAIYRHKFSKRAPPLMVYDVRNKLLHFVGGGYTLPAEGIDG